ncbi:SNF2-related protein [Vibrio sp. 1865]|uniref:SNF2-related protein n=2 Tax=Vibrio TaxID=662 RepID=UPI00296760AF|nr:SNF2-related protein [Vibrio sp. 1865]
MYRFLITTPFKSEVSILIDSHWEQKATVEMDGTAEDQTMIKNFIRFHGMTPDGRIAQLPEMAPMSAHYSFTTKAAIEQGFSIAFIEGEQKPYPHRDVVFDSAEDEEPSFTTKPQSFKLQDRYQFQGLPISIENKAGTKRSGVDPDGSEWAVSMHYDYGYIRSTKGTDQEGIDCYVGPNRKADHVYIVKQHAIEKIKQWSSKYCPQCKEHVQDCACPEFFDEDKVMLGFDNKEQARTAYLKQYDSDLFLGPISTMRIEDFKKAIAEADGEELDLPLQFVHDHAVLDSATDEQVQALLAAKDINELEATFNQIFQPIAFAGDREFGLKASGVKTREAINNKVKAIVDRIKASNWDTSTLTAEDYDLLVQYSGRGGLSENSQYEYYTPTYIAEGCWELLSANGFDNGNVLEPSAGAGVFNATKHQGVKMTATEIDPISSAVNKILHPEDNVFNQSFEKMAVESPDNHFDSVIGNIPFGSARGASAHDDPDHKSEKLIERYFINRLIDKVKPSGLLVLVVPVNIVRERGKVWQKWRAKISKKAEFLGAHKLPSKTFGKQGTGVVTDIIVLRKHSKNAAEKIAQLPMEQLQAANVLWDTFLEGKWWERDGKPFIHGKFVPKDASKVRDDDKVIRDASVTDVALKRKLAAKFHSRIDWEALDTAEPAIKNYVEGDRRVIDERTYEFTRGNWEPVDALQTTTDIDESKYGVASLEALQGLLESNHGLMSLSVKQAFAAMKAWGHLFSKPQKQAIEFAMTQPSDEYREQIFRGSLIGADLARFQNDTNQDNWNATEQMRLQELVANEINKYGHPKQNKGLILAGERSRYFGVFSNAMDENGDYSTLLTGEVSTKGLAFDDTNPHAIVEHLYLREGMMHITLEDIQQLYKGKTPIQSLSDLADDKNLAIHPDGLVMPMSRFCSGDVYQKVLTLSHALNVETDPKLKAKYQQQLEEIEQRRYKTQPENIAFSMRHKWIDRQYVLEFMHEKGYSNLDYLVDKKQVATDDDTGGSFVENVKVRDTSSPFGEFVGYEDNQGFNKQLNSWLNGGNVTSSKQEYIEEYKERVARLDEEFRLWMQQHKDIDDLAELYNQKFNSYIPFEHSDADLGLEGVSAMVKPHGYQCSAVRRLSEDGSGILGFDVGLGKTFSALALAAYNKQMGRANKTLIVVPNSVLANWYHEAKMFHGNLDNALFVGFKPKLDKDGQIQREAVKDEKGNPKKNKHTGDVEYQDILIKESAEEVFDKMHQIPQTSKSLVVMTFEKYKEIQMRPVNKHKYADKWVEKSLISDQMAASTVAGDDFSLGKGKDKISYKEAVRREALQQRFLEDGGHKKGEYPYFEDMGFQSVIIDEAHAFKNSFKAGDKTANIAYLPNPTESQRAIDMAMKMAYLRDQNEGRGPVLLSATPVTNSPLEIFNMLSLVLPVEEFEKFGVYTADDFVRVFGKVETVEKMTVKGEIVQKDGLVGFQNLDGLRNLFHRYTLMRNAEDVSLALPDAPETHESVDMTADQESAYESLREEAKEASKPARQRSANARALFAVMRDMDKVTTDMDLFNQTMTFTFPASKAKAVDQLIAALPASIEAERIEQTEDGEEVKRKVSIELDYQRKDESDSIVLVVPDVYEQAVLDRLNDAAIKPADVSHPLTPKYAKLVANLKAELEVKGKQIIFTEEKTQHHKLKRIIVNQLGLDEKQIGIINGSDAAGAKLQRIADAYNAGDIKIVICNKKAEVGVNLQKGTSAIHHLTLPWTPASIQQRNGRGVRQGNTASKVSLYYYLGKGSFDGYRLDLLNKKKSWMRDLFNGTESEAVNGNAIDNDDYLDMFEADPEAAKAKRMERLAQKQAERKRKSDLKCAVDLSQVIGLRSQLASWEADKAEDYNRLVERKDKAQASLSRIKEKGEDSSKAEQALARINKSLQDHDAKWEEDKAKLESRLSQRMTFLKQKASAGELPFDSAIIENPENAIVARDGSVLTVGTYFETDFGAILRIEQVEQSSRSVHYSVPVGDVSYYWWGRRNGEFMKADLDSMPDGLKHVSLSDDEVRVKQILSITYTYNTLSKLKKDQFVKYRDDIKLQGYGNFLFRVNGELTLASADQHPTEMLVYPDVSDNALKREIALHYLKLRREDKPMYAWREVVKPFFGDFYDQEIAEYGQKASQADVLAACDKAWMDYQPTLLEGIQLSSSLKGLPAAVAKHQAYRLARQDFQESAEDKAAELGDNRMEINRWVREFISGLESKLLDEAETAKRQAADAELEELKKNPAFKELPAEVKKGFEDIGVTARYNYKDVSIPRNGRYRARSLSAFQYFFLKDENGKAGKLFAAKDILKNRFGAKFCTAEGDWDGSWWYFPVSVDVKEVFEIIA